MSIESWDPSVVSLTARHRLILNNLAEQSEDAALLISEDDSTFLRPAMTLSADTWCEFVAAESDETVISWIRILTRIEHEFTGFEAGSRSPVLPLLNALKARGVLTTALMSWIKAHTRNRFLPYGSLADRLAARS